MGRMGGGNTFIDSSSPRAQTCWMGNKPGKKDPNCYVTLHTRRIAFHIVSLYHQCCNAVCRWNLEFVRDFFGECLQGQLLKAQ